MIKRMFFLTLLAWLLAACGTAASNQAAAPAANTGTGPVVEVFRAPT